MTAGATYEPIASQTLASAASSITFSSIAASWTDLRVVLVATASSLNQLAMLQFNSDTSTGSTNYSQTYIYGTGSAASSSRMTSTFRINLHENGMSDTIPHFYTADIFSYGGSTYKTVLTTGSEDRNGSGEVSRSVGLWRSTAAITSVTLSAYTATFSAGTIATLYGIKAA